MGVGGKINQFSSRYPEVMRAIEEMREKTSFEKSSDMKKSREEKVRETKEALRKLGLIFPILLSHSPPGRIAERTSIRVENLRKGFENMQVCEVRREIDEVGEFLRGYASHSDAGVRRQALASMKAIMQYIRKSRVNMIGAIGWMAINDRSVKNRDDALAVLEACTTYSCGLPNFINIEAMLKIAKEADTDREKELLRGVADKAIRKIGYLQWHMRNPSSGLVPYLNKSAEKAKSDEELIAIAKILEETRDSRCVHGLFRALKRAEGEKCRIAIIRALEKYNLPDNDYAQIIEHAFVSEIQKEGKSGSAVQVGAVRALATCKSMEAWFFCEERVKNPRWGEKMVEEFMRSRYIIWEKLDLAGEFDVNWKNKVQQYRGSYAKEEETAEKIKLPENLQDYKVAFEKKGVPAKKVSTVKTHTIIGGIKN